MKTLTLSALDGFQLGAYLAEPAGEPLGGIVVVQEIFGVNAHIRSICDRLAEAGYIAIAPAIFDRMTPGFEVGYAPKEIEHAKGLMQEFDIKSSLLDIEAARTRVCAAGNVGVVGFCLGGSLAWLAATRLDGFSAASSFYGGMVNQFSSETPRCPVQLHYGADDASIPAENYLSVRNQCPEAAFYLYENVGHGFNCDQRGSYAPEAAALAWDRTLQLFESALG
ncbi:dienelactone hydrolase family protein [uncultured Planktomarina sp.]|jgi:carboxymethylenebutenolidase|uniref:dienelactone hydrolase family protein n=1 Tax=uncultured Planktomarina sp. TaxID=1538529 RepID=UPI003261B56E|tara:strand:+ start:637 stop:1305 length:669 start_codon:yes stop_codon:yes gene_type:complete